MYIAWNDYLSCINIVFQTICKFFLSSVCEHVIMGILIWMQLQIGPYQRYACDWCSSFYVIKGVYLKIIIERTPGSHKIAEVFFSFFLLVDLDSLFFKLELAFSQ